jgi:PleD family two-component response regulator
MQESAELIIATDKQLYKAKSTGRNRMCVQVLD